MNNQYNNYNDYNNYNNQNGMYSQNNMYPQNNMYGYQQPMNNMQNNNQSNQGGGVGSVIFALLLLGVLVVALLHLTGTINVVSFVNEKILGKEETKEVQKATEENTETKKDEIDYKAEVTKICKLVDTEGNYNLEKVQPKINEMVSNNSEIITENPNAVLEVMAGNYMCIENTCMYIEPNDYYMHFVDCTTNDYNSGTVEELSKGIQKNLILEEACISVDSKGYYVGEDNVSCSDFVCTCSIDGEKYERNCRE